MDSLVRRLRRRRVLGEDDPRRRRSKKARYHLHRVDADIKILEGALGRSQITRARLLLSDFGTTEIHLFTVDSLRPGTLVSITLDRPARFYVKGRVVACQPYSLTTQVVFAKPYRYRVRIEFDFQNEKENQTVKDYCQMIRSQYVLAA